MAFRDVSVMADRCLGGLVVITLAQNAGELGSIPCWGSEFFRRNPLLHDYLRWLKEIFINNRIPFLLAEFNRIRSVSISNY